MQHRPCTSAPRGLTCTDVVALGCAQVLSIENLLRQLERQEGMMSKIQKALGEYLRRQRAAFSRFYFVGDEDLLEVIGNASEPSKVRTAPPASCSVWPSVACRVKGALMCDSLWSVGGCA